MRAVADSYPARETGFTWHENHDDTTAIGFAGYKAEDWRWEGVFWIWERRFMENTGGPDQKWNVRREWMSQPSSSRELYYSDVDERIHLFGAEEGWLQIGHFTGLGPIGEIRMYDTDGNGYFDRWETYRSGDSVPSASRVSGTRRRAASSSTRLSCPPSTWAKSCPRRRPPTRSSWRRWPGPAVRHPGGLEDGHGQGARELPAVRAGRGPGAPVSGRAGLFAKQANAILLADSAEKSGKEFAGDLRWLKRGATPDVLETTPNTPYRLAAGPSSQGFDLAYGEGDFDGRPRPSKASRSWRL